MSECKHDGNWRLQGAGGLNMDVVCEKCGAKIRDVLDSQERQLELVVKDISTNLPCVRCVIEECDAKRSGKPMAPAICAKIWRKRLEEMANHG